MNQREIDRMPFHFQPLEIPDVMLIQPKIFHDSRGAFMENYKHTEFMTFGITEHFVQDNVSRSSKNVIRGLHFQIPPHAQGKLVMALMGEIFDVAVDIRSGSPFYGRWIHKHLSQQNGHMLYVPPGFAHGFCALSDALVLYKCTAEYAPDHDRGILFSDPQIQVPWPASNPIVSDKDMQLPLLAQLDNPF